MKKKAVRRVVVSKKSPKKKYNPLTWFLGFSILITATFILLRLYYPPHPADIFVVDQPQLTYGDTAVTGVLGRSEDAFILDLGNNILVRLDIPNLDPYLGQTITAYGTLTMDIYGNNIMEVRETLIGTQ